MHVLCTGGAGFIGSHVVDRLLAADHRVTVLDNLDPQVHPTGHWPAYLPPRPGLTLIHGDVRDLSAPGSPYSLRGDGAVVTTMLRSDKILEGVEVVIHLAAAVGVGQSALQPAHYVDVNVRGTAALLEAIQAHGKDVRRLFVASSMSCYGEGLYREASTGTPYRPADRSPEDMAAGKWDFEPRPRRGRSPAWHDGTLPRLVPHPIPETREFRSTSIYAQSKAWTEELALLWGAQRDVPVTAGRFFNVYGPRQSPRNPYTGVAAIFASALLRGKDAIVYEDGHQTRDFVHVEDVAAAVVALSTETVYHGPVNVCTGVPTSIGELATAIRIAVQLSDRVLGVTDGPGEVRTTGQYRVGDIRSCIGSPARLRKVLARWEPRYLGADQIDSLVHWARTQDCSTDADPHAEMADAGLLRGGV